ncbi:MAG: phosphatidylglycerophosphatase A [Gammaproteobacteria bacterium]|nr:phosphatidylglycerophosphatase A [Gammaproteobacteria bacterium]
MKYFRNIWHQSKQLGFNPVHWLGVGLGSGLVPVAPGTVGSAVAVLWAWFQAPLSLIIKLSIVAVAFVLGIFICQQTAKALNQSDPGAVVWDEIVALVFVLALVPPEWQWWLVAFLFFRLFDIVKPWPIRDLDHSLHNGLGIMLDDIMAAIYAVIATTLANIIWITSIAKFFSKPLTDVDIF